MWCWRRTEKIIWTDTEWNEEVLLRVKEQRNILHEISERKVNWIDRILRWNCLLQRVIEGKIKGGIKVKGSRGRRRRKLLDDLKERRGYSNLKEEAIDHPMWRACFGKGFGPVVRQTTKWIIDCIYLNAVLYSAEFIFRFLNWDIKFWLKFVCPHKPAWYIFVEEDEYWRKVM